LHCSFCLMDHCCSVAFEASVFSLHLITLKVTSTPGTQMPSERALWFPHRFVLQ
ncbi:hypothetical protein M9458_048041, partial [Cirrhinus mrigala]